MNENHEKNQWKVSEEDSGARLDKWLASPARLGSRSRALDAIRRGKIFVAGVEQNSADTGRKLLANEIVRFWIDRPGSAQKRYSERHASGLHLLYEDQALLVVNKPAGILTVPLPKADGEISLLDLVKKHLRSKGKTQPLIVHRIDRDTSGIVLFAKNFQAQRALKPQFEHHRTERIYLAVVYGYPQPESGTWRDTLVWDRNDLKQHPSNEKNHKAKEAICRYRTLEVLKDSTLIEVRLVTGKRNQIRVQAGLRGYPLVGEKMYRYENAPKKLIPFGRQALHAYRLAFIHPIDGKEMKFEAALPDDMEKLILKLRNAK